jgi:dihydropteroate synthase
MPMRLPEPGLEKRSVRGLPVLARPLVMGVVNVTPDSFSDGGLFRGSDDAVAHGLALLAEGADLLDIGGESTRPGATRPLVTEELARVIPVITALADQGALVSVDTMRAEVAEAALDAGATVVNDVSGGLADPAILRVVAERDAAYVAMHWRGHADTMQRRASYADVVGEVAAELRARVDDAVAAGVAPDRIAIDPGLGFAKTADHNWELLGHLEALDALGLPILLGSSRKSFIGALLAGPDGNPRPVLDREDANVALTTLAGLLGVWAVRVHEARASVDALKVVARWRGEGLEGPSGQVFGPSGAPGKVGEDE